ncbi:porin Omp33-36 [Acinetobacter pullicarnis]|uniref:porin Omp33-36 n=1 Tax=Acinetobacter pullicarnis TaxID=2576829 RepID=UPI0011217A00|nr:porin Omp33-36 [Acinetobacter pullicarnis]
MKKLGLATALLLAMTGAQAYQFEVQGQSEYIDTTQNGKNFTGGVEGTYYLKDVDSSKGPLAEAAFINQASNVSAAYSYLKYDEKTDDVNIKSQNYGVKAEGYIPTSVVPVYASASYNHTFTKVKNNGDDNGDRYALEVGAVVIPNLLVAAGYTNVPNQFSMDTFGIMNNGIASAFLESEAINEKQDSATIRAKYVGPITGTNMSFGFETAAAIGEDTLYGLKSDLYLNNKLSVGMKFIGTDATHSYFDQAWGGDVNYFITPAVGVGVSYLHANTKGVSLDTDTVGLNAKFRF